MALSLPPLLPAAFLSLFLEKIQTIFHGHSSPVSNEEAEGHWLIRERLWYWYMSFYIVILVSPDSFLLSCFSGALSLECICHFYFILPKSRALKSRTLKLTRIFLSDMSDSTSEIPENMQVFTSFSIPMAMCLSEDLMENTPLQTRKIYLTFAKICPEKQNQCLLATGTAPLCVRVNTSIGWRSP